MKTFLPLLIFILCVPAWVRAQDGVISLQGRVISASDSLPLPGASITIKGSVTGTTTDPEGNFQLTVPEGSIVVFSYIGFSSREIPVPAGSPTSLTVILTDDYLTLSEVEIYSTGYQEVPAERATGSFEHIDNKLFNRSVSTDVISRLEGVTSGLLFDTRINSTPDSSPPQLRIRGLSSMYGEGFSGVPSSKESPLIVVDNFPYEGDITSINPNDVESITILKDAAAASIWGAKAGNGVIVITTKKGHFHQPLKVSFNSNVTVSQKPDLFYSPDFLDAAQFIEVEKQLFDQDFYTSDENDTRRYPVLSPAVEILIAQRDGAITEAQANQQLALLSDQDVRGDAEKYLYREAVNQQKALNLSGGSDRARYYVSGGYDKNLSSVVANQSQRITFNSDATFKLLKNLDLTTGLYYIQRKSQSDGLPYNRLQTKSRLPYLQLSDIDGSPFAIPYRYRESYLTQSESEGLLDWHYYPLREINLTDDNTRSRDNRFRLGFNYEVVSGLKIDLKYQYQNTTGEHNRLDDKDSYLVRNLVNHFTQEDGEQIFPYGDILTAYNTSEESHMGRAEITYDKTVGQKHRIVALAGAEIRQVHQAQQSFQLYGYDDDVLTYQSQFDYITRYAVKPYATSRIPLPSNYLEDYLDRFVSYFTNVSYTYQEKYIYSGSIRWDASNLFGVKTNQKGVPLWSSGISWLLNRENFYNSSWLPMLKVRATYGLAGNIDKSATAFPTASYSTDNLTDLPSARLTSPGNPQLRWEKIKTINTGIDFAFRNGHVNGSLEYYRKRSTDLIAPIPLDPTTGYLARYNVNYASLVINGMDVDIQTAFNLGPVKWQSSTLVNYARDKVIDFRYDGEGDISWYTQSNNTLPVEGQPLYTLYSYPWVGLDPATGDPLVNIEGLSSTNYVEYYSQVNPNQDLVNHGPQVAPVFGSLRETFSWKGFSLSANVTWKAGYYFRRSSLSYSQLFDNGVGHMEFRDRWQKPGDELFMQIPSMPSVVDVSANRDRIYSLSELTVEKGDHIRLQDVTLSYEILRSKYASLPFERMRIYGYARNVGILWRANDKGLDPDYPSSIYPPTKSFALGLQIDF